MSEFYITQADWNTIQQYSRYAYEKHKSEIGGMCIAEKDKNGDYFLKNPVILKQSISASNTELSKEALASYYTKTAMKMKDKDYQFVWWHSHHTMNAFWSSTDLKAIEEMNQGDMSISLVVNLKEEYVLRVNIWKPYPAVADELDLNIISNKPDIPKYISEKVEKLCSDRSTSISNYYNNRSNGYNYGGYSRVMGNGQMSVFNVNNYKKASDEDEGSFLTIAERIVDDGIQDYLNDSINYCDFVKNMHNCNASLAEKGSKYRIGFASDEDEFRSASLTLDALGWIHEKDVPFVLDDVLSENDISYDWTPITQQANLKGKKK